MKNLLKILGLSVLVSFIALGCSNTSGDAVSNGAAAKNTASKTITLVATGDEGAIAFPTATGISPSIVADTVDAANDLKYYLFTRDKTSTVWVASPNNPLTFSADDAAIPNVGKVDLKIDDGYYDFELFAIDPTNGPTTATSESDVKGKALFWGQTEADLRLASDTVSFYLTSDGLTGKANISIGLKTVGWTCDLTNDYEVTALITKKTDGTTVPGTTPQRINTLTTSDPTTNQYTESSGVNPGTYNFEVRFVQKRSDPKTYTWSDTIIVASNHNIDTIIAIPKVVEEAPAAPTAFNATFEDPKSTSAGYYNVEFVWAAAASVNENYFKIELLDVTGIAYDKIQASTTPWDWSSTYMTTDLNKADGDQEKYGKDFYGDQRKNWVSGTLYKNSTRATMQLPLGKSYLARIAAVNDAGDSDYCYVDFGATIPTATTTGYRKFAAAAKVINRYRLTYNLMGGTITKADNSTDTENIVEYRTQNDQANATAGTYVGWDKTADPDVLTADIWNPATDTTTYKSLKSSTGKEWTSWRLVSGQSGDLYDTTPASSPYNPPDYTDGENLTLFASYVQTTAPVTIHDDNEWNITIENISGTIPAGAGVYSAEWDSTASDYKPLTKDLLESYSAIVYNKADASANKITWTIAKTASQPDYVKWDKVEYAIYKTENISNAVAQGVCSGSPLAVDTDFKLPNGNYAITFYAYTSRKTMPYSCTVYVNVIEK